MTLADVNPAIALLHAWEKAKKTEHESGAFGEQLRSQRPAGMIEVEPVPVGPDNVAQKVPVERKKPVEVKEEG